MLFSFLLPCPFLLLPSTYLLIALLLAKCSVSAGRHPTFGGFAAQTEPLLRTPSSRPHWLGWLLHWTNSGKLLLRAFCIACCIAAASHSVAQCFTRSKILLSTFRCTATTTPPCVPLSFSRFLLLFSFLLFFVSSFLLFFLLRFNSGPNIKLSVRHLYTSQYVIDSCNRRRGLALSSFLLVCTTLRSQPPGLCGCVQRAELLWPWSFLSCHNRAANTHYTPANQHTTPYDTTR